MSVGITTPPEAESVEIPLGDLGTTEGLVDWAVSTRSPERRLRRPKLLAVLGHGAGGDYDAPLLADVAGLLNRRGCNVVRFRFLYRRGGRRPPDPRAKLEQTFRAVVDWARDQVGPQRLVIGGKSMGGRMATHLAAGFTQSPETAKGLRANGVLLLGYPLHPPGKPDRLRIEHLPALPCPALFFQGTRDPLAELPLVKKHLVPVRQATVALIEDGDHSLDVRKKSGRTRADVLAQIDDALARWLPDEIARSRS